MAMTVDDVSTVWELVGLARAIRRFEVDRDWDARVALAWLLRNFSAAGRERAAGSVTSAAARLAPDLGACSPADGGDGAAVIDPEADVRQSMSIAAGVLNGDYGDPTRGATRAHRHDAPTPAWAETLEPTALIGPWLFYRRAAGGSAGADPFGSAARAAA